MLLLVVLLCKLILCYIILEALAPQKLIKYSPVFSRYLFVFFPKQNFKGRHFYISPAA